MKTEKTMKNISAWPWKGIWHSLGVLAILLSMAYSPYLLLSGRLDRMDRRLEAMDRKMDRRFEAMDRRFESIDDKLANIDKRLAVVEDRVGVTAPRVSVRLDSTLAPRAGAEPVALPVLDAEATPRSSSLSRRFALSGVRLLCDILSIPPPAALFKAG